MGTVLLVLQIFTAVVFIILMAIQTDKNEQSGVMGLGAQGGRMSGSIDMPVGAERILKPLSKWVAVGFLFSSAMASIHAEKSINNGPGLPWWGVLAGIALYVAVMLLGDTIYKSVMRVFGAGS